MLMAGKSFQAVLPTSPPQSTKAPKPQNLTTPTPQKPKTPTPGDQTDIGHKQKQGDINREGGRRNKIQRHQNYSIKRYGKEDGDLQQRTQPGLDERARGIRGDPLRLRRLPSKRQSHDRALGLCDMQI
jgi:hypothetical protein